MLSWVSGWEEDSEKVGEAEIRGLQLAETVGMFSVSVSVTKKDTFNTISKESLAIRRQRGVSQVMEL